MSDVGLGANLDLNITDALRRVDQLGAALGNVAAVRVQVDTSQVAPQISAAVDAADSVVTVEPDTAGLATEITGAVDAADSTVEVTGDAAGVTGAIDGAVDAADTGVVVTADTGDVVGSIEGAVDAADAAVVVTADASDVTGSINASVENADSAVEITGTASGVTAAIDAAVADADQSITITASDQTGSTLGAVRQRIEGLTAADQLIVLKANVTQAEQAIRGIERQLGDEALSNEEVRVLVDARGEASRKISQLQGQIANLDAQSIDIGGDVDPSLAPNVEAVGDSLDAAATSGIGLKKILATVTVGAAAAGLRFLADAASDLAESTSKAGVVFADEFPAIERFAVGAADSVGLSTQAALEAAGTFGNLFQALGSSREEAARLSPQVVQLAGDLASFNNIGTDEALEKLRSGLVGEIEPLRALGVSFNATDVERKALELGIGTLGAELTEGEKVQARFALITEQTTLAQGDFARTAEGLANQQRTLRAELANTAAAAGQDLLPAFLAIGAEARNAIPGLEQLASNVLPALSEALVALSPLIGTTVDLLVAFSPVVQAVASVVGALPTPLVEAAGALLLLNRSLVLVRGSVELLGLAKIAGGLANLVVPAAAVSGAFAGTAVAATGVKAGLGAIVASINPATAALAAGVAAVLLYNDTMADARKEGEAFGSSLRASFDPSTASLSELRDASAQLGEKITFLKDEVDDSFLGRNTVNRDFNAAIGEGVEQTEAFRAEIDATAAALEASNIREGFEAQFGDVIGSVVGASDALERLRSTTPETVTAIQSLRLSSQGTDRQILDMALSLGAADLSSEEMADAAKVLGLDVDDLGTLITSTTEALDAFVSSAVAGLPTVQDVFASTLGAAQEGAQQVATGIREAAAARADAVREAAAARVADAGLSAGQADAIRDAAERNATAIVDAAETSATAVEESGRVTAAAFTESLLTAAADMADFREDLALITSHGFSDVAGLLAQTGQEQGGALADELSAALAAGNETLLVKLSEANTLFETETQASVDFMRDVLGPQLILQSGLIGESSAQALFEGVDFSERIRIQGELAQTELDEQGKALAVIAAIEGDDTAREYGEALDLDERTITAAIAAGRAIRNNAPTRDARAAGVATGFAYQAGFIQQLLDDIALRAAARKAAGDMSFAFADQLGVSSPSTVAMKIGAFFMEGLALGFTDNEAAVVAAAESVVRAAVAAAEGVQAGPLQFDVTPPPDPSVVAPPPTTLSSADLSTEQAISSQFAAGIGGFLMEGLALGITNSGSEVVAAAETIARDAVDAVARVAPEVTASITVGGGATGGQGEVTESLIRALEAVAASGGRGETLQFSPTFNGGDTQANLREATLELRAIARRFW